MTFSGIRILMRSARKPIKNCSISGCSNKFCFNDDEFFVCLQMLHVRLIVKYADVWSSSITAAQRKNLELLHNHFRTVHPYILILNLCDCKFEPKYKLMSKCQCNFAPWALVLLAFTVMWSLQGVLLHT